MGVGKKRTEGRSREQTQVGNIVTSAFQERGRFGSLAGTSHGYRTFWSRLGQVSSANISATTILILLKVDLLPSTAPVVFQILQRTVNLQNIQHLNLHVARRDVVLEICRSAQRIGESKT